MQRTEVDIAERAAADFAADAVFAADAQLGATGGGVDGGGAGG